MWCASGEDVQGMEHGQGGEDDWVKQETDGEGGTQGGRGCWGEVALPCRQVDNVDGIGRLEVEGDPGGVGKGPGEGANVHH